MEFLGRLFETGYFMPHGHCFLWEPGILWLSVLSDAGIALAYFAIPLSLLYFVSRRKDVPFKGVFVLFASFILACGATHLMGLFTVWDPLYRLESVVKAMTAVISIGTAVVLIPVIPRALSLRTPKEMEAANRALEKENAERRKAEEELVKAGNELEERVAARTAELARTNERLRDEIKTREEAERRKEELLRELESANSDLTDFAHVVSHDLKAPLQAITTLTDWLEDDVSEDLGENGKAILARIKGRVSGMSALIDGILSYTKAGKEHAVPQCVDVRELLDEIVGTITPPGHIEISLASHVGKIYCDRTRLGQVFQNLITNAIKYNDKKKGLIKIGCERAAGSFRFSFADNGIGIDRRHFEEIFQIFRTSSPRAKGENGGVGLAIVKKIIESYGGRIWLESRPGSGTTFYFTLPDMALGRAG